MTPKQLTHHGGKTVTRAAHRAKKTAGEKCQPGKLTPGRLNWISMMTYTPGANSPYDCGIVIPIARRLSRGGGR